MFRICVTRSARAPLKGITDAEGDGNDRCVTTYVGISPKLTYLCATAWSYVTRPMTTEPMVLMNGAKPDRASAYGFSQSTPPSGAAM